MKIRLCLYLSMTLLLIMQTGCVFDNDLTGTVCPDKTESLTVNLNLTVPASSTATRSMDDDLVPGSKNENYINITDGDYQVLLFDKDGALVEDKLSEFKCKENGVNGGMTSYTLTTKLSLSGNEDKKRLSIFKVMVLANWKSFERSNTDATFEYPSFEGYNLSGTTNNIYKERAKFNFTFATPTKESPNCWMPSIKDRRAIPMFGITDDVDLQFAIDMAKYGDEPSFSVPMLRALAKIEIVDVLPEGISISEVKLDKANTTGRIIPDIDIDANSAWHDNEVQISSPSLPTPSTSVSNLVFVKNDTRTAKDKNGTDRLACPVWTIYIPEMDLTTGTRPKFLVKCDGYHDSEFLFDNYNDKGEEQNSLASVLRNHIYRYNATNIKGTTLEVELEVEDWETVETEKWDYTDNVIVGTEGVIKNWTWSGDEGFEGVEGYISKNQLVMAAGTQVSAVGTFKIESPKGASWYAFLRPTSNKEDAFIFVDEKGEELTNPNGVIDGKPATIRIRNRYADVSNENNTALLVIMVQLLGGQWEEADICGNGDNWTIVQNRTDIYENNSDEDSGNGD